MDASSGGNKAAHLGKLGRPVFGTTTKVCYLLCETEKRKEHGYLGGVQNGLARMAVTQGTVFFWRFFAYLEGGRPLQALLAINVALWLPGDARGGGSHLS